MVIFYFLGVGPPCCSILCQFWLCEEAQCVYLRRHLGSPTLDLIILRCLKNLVWSKCTVFMKSTVEYSNAQAFPCTHRSLTASPKTTSSPASSVLAKCSAQGYFFTSFIPHFTVPFLFLDMFTHTDTYYCVTIAYSIQYNNMQCRLVA